MSISFKMRMLQMHRAAFSVCLGDVSIAEYRHFLFPKISTYNPFILTDKNTEAPESHLCTVPSAWGGLGVTGWAQASSY